MIQVKEKSQLKKSNKDLWKYAAFFFAFTVLYHIIVVNRLGLWKLNDVTYSVYCMDFSFGFAAKLLPGAVFRLLFGSDASRLSANIYAVILILIFFAGLSVLLSKFMLRMPQQYKNSALVLLFFFITGGYTFAIYTKWVGILDTNWLLISLVFFLCLECRKLRWCIPLLFVLSLFIHYSAIVFFLTTFSILLLYKASVTDSKKERIEMLVVFAVSVIITFVLFFFFILNESLMIGSLEDLRKMLVQRGVENTTYQEYAFFRLWDGKSFIPDSLNHMKPSPMKFVYLFYYQAKLLFDIFLKLPEESLTMSIGGFLLVIPLVLFIMNIYRKRMRGESTRFKRFCAFIMFMQFPFVYALAIPFAISVDMTRYLAHGLLAIFTCLLYVLYQEEEARKTVFKQIAGYQNSLALKIYFLAYATVTFMPSI